MATLRTAALHLLRLAGFQSIRTGMQAVMHAIAAMLAMVTHRPNPAKTLNQPWVRPGIEGVNLPEPYGGKR